ncbi:hypothetical protein QMO17_35465, partial [Klebsiella pneumoniae]|nr:hypothetical protein [Klebsiella pneumoniae]
ITSVKVWRDDPASNPERVDSRPATWRLIQVNRLLAGASTLDAPLPRAPPPQLIVACTRTASSNQESHHGRNIDHTV